MKGNNRLASNEMTSWNQYFKDKHDWKNSASSYQIILVNRTGDGQTDGQTVVSTSQKSTEKRVNSVNKW